MKKISNNIFFLSIFNIKQYLHYILWITYVILVLFISLFIVHRTTLTHYNFNWFDPLTNILRYILFFLGITSCFFESKRKFVLCVCYFVIAFVTYTYGNSWVLFDLFFIPLFLSKNLKISTVIDIFFYLILFGTIATIAMDLLDYLPKHQHNFYRFYRESQVIRYSLGFSHPNSLGMMLMLISMLVVLKVKIMKLWHLIFIMSLCILCSTVPKSYTSSAVIFCLCMISCIKSVLQKYNIDFKRKNIIFFLTISFFTIVIVGSYVIALTDIIPKEIVAKIPVSLYSRFSFGEKAFTQFGFSLFGQEYHPVFITAIMNGAPPSSFFVVDCLYFYMPIFVGVIPTLIYLFLFYRAAWLSINKGNYILLFVLIMISIYSISEYLVIFPLFMFAYFDYGNSFKSTEQKIPLKH